MTKEKMLVLEHLETRQLHMLEHGEFHCPKISLGHKPERNHEGFCVRPLEGDDYCEGRCCFNLRGVALEKDPSIFFLYESVKKKK